MYYLLSIICGGFVGITVYLWFPLFYSFLKRYRANSEEKCERVFKEIFFELPKWKKMFFYFIGPIVSVLVAFSLFRSLWLKFAFAIAFSLLTANLPYKIVLHMKKKRILKIKSQLVDSLSLISNALKSGLSLQQAIQMAAEEMPAPISEEFQLVVSSQRLGKTFDAALIEFQRRIPLEEVELLMSSLVTLRETGGNIIETIDIITHTIREEQRVKAKIRTITTQGVAQAVVISALPFFLMGALYAVSPDYIEPLFSHWLGWAMIGFMLLLQATGMFIMKKIITIKV